MLQLGQKIFSTEERPYDICRVTSIEPEIGKFVAEYPDGFMLIFSKRDIHVTIFEEGELSE